MAIEHETVAVATTGGAGSATGSATTPAMMGYLLDVYFDFAAAPATTDTTVAYGGNGGNLIVLTNTNADAMHAPRKQSSDAAGAAISGGYDLYPLNGPLTVSIAQCDALSPALTVTFRYQRA